MGEKAYIVTETIGGMLWQSYPEVYVQENLFENTQDFAVSFHAIERSALKNKGKNLFNFWMHIEGKVNNILHPELNALW